jgi:hypothetical protein
VGVEPILLFPESLAVIVAAGHVTAVWTGILNVNRYQSSILGTSGTKLGASR